MLKKPFAVLVTLATSLSMLAVGSAATAAPTGDPIPDSLPALPDYAEASGVTFIGPKPGAANASVAGNVVSLSNKALEVDFDVAGTPQVKRFHNLVTGQPQAVTQNGLLWSSGGSVDLSTLVWTRTGAPLVANLAPDPESVRLADDLPGKAVKVTYRGVSASLTIDLTWTVELRDGANYIQQHLAATVVAGTLTPSGSVPMQLGILDVTLPNVQTTSPVDGSPVASGARNLETFFASVEHPMAKLTMGTSVRQSIPTKKTYAANSGFTGSIVYGVSAPGQLRRSAGYYIARERVQQRNTFLHYQSWYDLKPNPPGTANPLMVNSELLKKSMSLFGNELTKRSAKIDSFWVDDGWDYLRDPQVANDLQLPVWSFDPTQYPTGFAPHKQIADQFDASMSVWMSPFGGYGTSASRRAQINATAGKPVDKVMERNGAGFALGGEKYGQHFRDVVFDMIDNNGVRGFKFDGIGGGLYQTGPNQSYVADYEAMLELLDDMRDHEPEIWVNATVGTWGSPYWLWYVDSIWRDGGDAVIQGSGAWNAVEGSSTDRYISYRDGESFRNHTLRNRLFPTVNLMNHGLIFSPRGSTEHFDFDTDLSKPEVMKDAKKAMKAYFGLGLGLQELYIRSTAVDPVTVGAPANEFWDAMAMNAKWARDNEQLLTDSRMIGGDPSQNVYGNVSWNAADGGDGILLLRNPTAQKKTFTVDPARLFELPEGVSTRYEFTERDEASDRFVTDRYRTYTFELDPFEVLIFEAEATSKPVTPSPLEAPPAELRLDAASWTATANTEETSGENGRASNLLDNNPATIWHSRYNGGAQPVPHSVTIDMGKPTTFERLDYVPRTVGTNGTIANYKWEASTDGTIWNEISSGTWAVNSTVKSVALDTPLTARFVRLTAPEGGAKGNSSLSAITSGGDINLYAPASATVPSAPPAQQSPITNETFNHLLNGNSLTAKPGTQLVVPDAPTGLTWFSLSDKAGNQIPLGWAAGDPGVVSSTVTLPADLVEGTYQLELRDLGGAVIGWAPLSITSPAAPPSITPILPVEAETGTAISVQIQATGTALTYSATGLPAGLSIDQETGRISGTVSAEGVSTVTVTVTDSFGHESSVTFSITVKATPTPSPTKTPSAKPSQSPSAKPTQKPDTGFQPSAPYTLPGVHNINGRSWNTTCEPYSQTTRCRTDIWASVVVKGAKGYEVTQGWAFNNLTYLPYMERSAWAGNPLGHTTRWSATDGRQWMTECDTEATGRGACRSYTLTTVVAATARKGGGYDFLSSNKWVFNNMVLFKS